MKQLFALLLSIAITPSFAQANGNFEEFAKKYEGCFILYDVNLGKVVSEYNPNKRCSQRISPNSTFKVPLSLIAFNEKIINQNYIFNWDGTIYEMPHWSEQQNPRSWILYSVVWVSQQLTHILGMERITPYLASFKYGNQDFSGGLDKAWLNNSLTISAQEQLEFLKAMVSYKLPISHDAVDYTKVNMYGGNLKSGAIYFGKTGSGSHAQNAKDPNSTVKDGWFVGFIDKGKEQYIFVSNLTEKVPNKEVTTKFGSALLKPYTLKWLNEFFAKG